MNEGNLPSSTCLQRPPLEMWAGIECTVHRLRDQYYGQLERNGHATRLDDLDRVAALGVRALRYPVLWERTAPDGPESADWRWADERLGRLRELGVRPIVGLVHHGSSPGQTSRVDPGFVDGLAAYASAVAERSPWVEEWTPVNEPLMTARFTPRRRRTLRAIPYHRAPSPVRPRWPLRLWHWRRSRRRWSCASVRCSVPGTDAIPWPRC